MGIDRLVVFRGEVEGDEGGCSEGLGVAECIDVLAVLRAVILRLGMPGLTVVRGDPSGHVRGLVGVDGADDGREVEEPEGKDRRPCVRESRLCRSTVKSKRGVNNVGTGKSLDS